VACRGADTNRRLARHRKQQANVVRDRAEFPAARPTAIALYVVVAVLAIIGGVDLLRTEAVLLTVLIFVNFNIGWLLLFAPDQKPQTAGT
jgi:hypothetical protein